MEQDQLSQYIPVLILALVATAAAVGMLATSVAVGKIGRRNRVKDTPYECGMLPIGEGNVRMSVKFYLVAMLFILFDIEVVFFYPWAISFGTLRNAGMHSWLPFMLAEVVVFIAILLVGYGYLWKKGAFNWD